MATLEDTFLEDLEDDDEEDALIVPVLISRVLKNEFDSKAGDELDLLLEDFNADPSASGFVKKEERGSEDVDMGSAVANDSTDSSEHFAAMSTVPISSVSEFDACVFDDMEAAADIDMIEAQASQCQDSAESREQFSVLLDNERLTKHMSRMEAMSSGEAVADWSEEYALILDCAKLIADIDADISRLHKYARDVYGRKFGELEQMVAEPIEYALCVKLLANASGEELNAIPLTSVLSPSVAMMVHISAATATRKLSAFDLDRVTQASDKMLALNSAKAQIMQFVASKIESVAPNCCALIGAEITGQLVATVGSVNELQRIPACNLQVVGAKTGGKRHCGIVFNCALVQSCPKDLQRKALRVVSNKLALCVRCDANGDAKENSTGLKMYEKCRKSIEKWTEPPPPKPHRALPVPDSKPKKRRGGKRYRKMRERYRVTETQKMQNRLAFNKAEAEVIDGDGQVVGLGMLHSAVAGGGKLRSIAPKSTALHKVHKRMLLKQQRLRKKAQMAGTVSGLQTSLALPSGIELVNPESVDSATKRKAKGTYFDSSDTFGV